MKKKKKLNSSQCYGLSLLFFVIGISVLMASSANYSMLMDYGYDISFFEATGLMMILIFIFSLVLGIDVYKRQAVYNFCLSIFINASFLHSLEILFPFI